MNRRKIFHLIVPVLFAFSIHAGAVYSATDGGERYKVIFPMDHKVWVGASQIKEGHDGQTKKVRDLVNQAARSGYHLRTFLAPMAIVTNDLKDSGSNETGIYEYDVWDEPYFDYNIDQMNLLGYRFFGHFTDGRVCERWEIGNSNEESVSCYDLDTYLVKRTAADHKKLEQILVMNPLHVDKAETISRFDKRIAEGFRPIQVVPAGVIMEKPDDPKAAAKDHAEFKMLMSIHGNIRKLAAQGFRIQVTNDTYTVMVRNDRTRNAPATYTWVNANKGDFSKELAVLQQQGAVYRAVIPDGKSRMSVLVFESPMTRPKKASEFKVLELELVEKTGPVDGKTYLDLSEDAKRSVAEMNKLANEGFAVRDLFRSGKIAVLLERIK